MRKANPQHLLHHWPAENNLNMLLTIQCLSLSALCVHLQEAQTRAEAFVARTLGKAFYYRARGPLSSLLREPFLSSCVLKGGFSALALNAPSDQGNSFAILPSGVLVLSLDRESFQVRPDISVLPSIAKHSYNQPP